MNYLPLHKIGTDKGSYRDRVALWLHDGKGNLLVQDDRDRGLGIKFPGGGIDEGQSINDAAIREALEEVGYSLANKPKAIPGIRAKKIDWDPIFSAEAAAKGRNYRGSKHYHRLALVGEPDKSLLGSEGDALSANWMPIAELLEATRSAAANPDNKYNYFDEERLRVAEKVYEMLTSKEPYSTIEKQASAALLREGATAARGVMEGIAGQAKNLFRNKRPGGVPEEPARLISGKYTAPKASISTGEARTVLDPRSVDPRSSGITDRGVSRLQENFSSTHRALPSPGAEYGRPGRVSQVIDAYYYPVRNLDARLGESGDGIYRSASDLAEGLGRMHGAVKTVNRGIASAVGSVPVSASPDIISSAPGLIASVADLASMGSRVRRAARLKNPLNRTAASKATPMSRESSNLNRMTGTDLKPAEVGSDVGMLNRMDRDLSLDAGEYVASPGRTSAERLSTPRLDRAVEADVLIEQSRRTSDVARDLAAARQEVASIPMSRRTGPEWETAVANLQEAEQQVVRNQMLSMPYVSPAMREEALAAYRASPDPYIRDLGEYGQQAFQDSTTLARDYYGRMGYSPVGGEFPLSAYADRLSAVEARLPVKTSSYNDPLVLAYRIGQKLAQADFGDSNSSDDMTLSFDNDVVRKVDPKDFVSSEDHGNMTPSTNGQGYIGKTEEVVPDKTEGTNYKRDYLERT